MPKRGIGRRLLIIALTSVVVVVLLAGLSIAGFRILVAWAPGYRGALATWVSDMAGQPVDIGSMELTWSHWQPTLVLGDVSLLRRAGHGVPMHLDRVRLGFSLIRTIQGDFVPDRVVMAGLRLTVERDGDGDFRIHGMKKKAQAAGPADGAELLHRLTRISHVGLRDSRIRLRDRLHPRYSGVFDNVHGHVDGAGGGLTGTLAADLPAAVGGHLEFAFRISGDSTDLSRLRISGDAVVRHFRPGPWLRPYLLPGVTVSGDIDTLHLSGTYADGAMQRASARLDTGPLVAHSGTADGAQAWALFRHLGMVAEWRRNAAGWAVSMSDINLVPGGGAAGAVPAGMQAHLGYRAATAGSSAAFAASVPRLPLAALRPWLRVLRLPGPDWLAATAPAGELRDVEVDWSPDAGAGGIAVSGRLSGVSTAPVGRIPGILGLDGGFRFGPDGGQARLHIRGGILTAPTVFARPLPIGHLAAQVDWRPGTDGWRVHSSDIEVQTLGGRASGQFDLNLPADGTSPVIDLQASFSADAVRAARPFVPLTLPPKLQRWLRHSIASGRVSDGELLMKGALDDYPFVGKPGQFKVEFSVEDGNLAYADDWPAISNIDAHLRFEGRSMYLKTTRARMMGVALGPVSAQIDEFREPLLRVDGQADAELSRQLAFLGESPLHERYRGLLNALDAKGPAAIRISLAIPLEDVDRTRVEGDITLYGDRIDYRDWPQPFTNVRGTLHFSDDGLVAEGLTAQMQGLALNVNLAPAPGEHDRTLVVASTRLTLPADRAVVAPYVPALILDRLSGSSLWRLSLSFSRNAAAGAAEFTSDLAGTTVDFPLPLHKSPAEHEAVQVTVDPRSEGGLQVHVAAGGMLDALVELQQGADKNWQFDRGLIRLGGAKAVLPPQPGLWVDGRALEADMAGWVGFVRAISGSAGAGGGDGSLFRGANLYIGTARGFGQHWRQVTLNLSREPDDWLLTLASPDVEGTIRALPPRDATGRVQVTADMARMRLRLPSFREVSGEAAGDAAPLDPKTLPALSLQCAACTLNDLSLGRLVVQVDALPDGLLLRNLEARNRDLQLHASGRWTRTGGRSMGGLDVQIETRQLQTLIEALGYAPGIQAEKSRLDATLDWSPSASGLGLANLGGKLSLRLDDGVLSAVDPGAGRVLGLLNFYTLPRRLMLDFSDVVDKGLAFDRIRGHFVFRDGSAYTQGEGLTLEGPSLRMVMKGRVGLVARDYDEKITVYPEVGASLPIAGTVLGGPAVGIFVLLAQQLLGKPLQQLTQFSYHVGGTWEYPRITHAQ